MQQIVENVGGSGVATGYQLIGPEQGAKFQAKSTFLQFDWFESMIHFVLLHCYWLSVWLER